MSPWIDPKLEWCVWLTLKENKFQKKKWISDSRYLLCATGSIRKRRVCKVLGVRLRRWLHWLGNLRQMVVGGIFRSARTGFRLIGSRGNILYCSGSLGWHNWRRVIIVRLYTNSNYFTWTVFVYWYPTVRLLGFVLSIMVLNRIIRLSFLLTWSESQKVIVVDWSTPSLKVTGCCVQGRV